MMDYYLVRKRHEIVTDTGTATTLHCLKAEWEQNIKQDKEKIEESTSSAAASFGPIRTRQLFSKIKEKLARHDGFFQAFFRSHFQQPPMISD